MDVSKYSNYDDYAYDVDVYRIKLEWRDEWDCDSEFDVNPCDFEYEEYYFKALKRAWKNKYDPNNEYTNIDPCDYSIVEEYHEAIMDFDIRSTKL